MIGDVIAFNGKDLISNIVKVVTWSNISHVGILISDTEIIESTVNTHQIGVKINNLADKIKEYNGTVWQLKLHNTTKYQQNVLVDYLSKQQGSTYDPFEAVEAGLVKYLPFLRSYFTDNKSRFFCSELVASALVEANILPKWLKTSQVTPTDLVRFNIYKRCVLLKGKGIPIKFNGRLY